MKKSVLLSITLFSFLSFSKDFNFNLSTGYNFKYNGFFYKNIENIELFPENINNKYKILGLNYKYKDYINFKTDLYSTNNKKYNSIYPYIETKFKTPKFYNTNISYKLNTYLGDNLYSNTKKNTFINTLEIKHKNNLILGTQLKNNSKNLISNEEYVDIFTKYIDINAYRYEINEEEKHLLDYKKDIKYLMNLDDGHDHDNTSELEYNIDKAKNIFGKHTYKNVKYGLKLSHNRKLNKKENIKISSNFSSKYSNNKWGNYLDHDLFINNFDINLKYANNISKNLNIYSGIDFNYINHTEKENKKIIPKNPNTNIDDYYATKLITSIISNTNFYGLHTISNSLIGGISYKYKPTSNVELDLGIDTKISLISKKSVYKKDVLENRKNAYLAEIKRADNAKNNKTPEEVEETNKKIKELNSDIKKIDNKIDEFNKSTNFDSIVDEYYNSQRIKNQALDEGVNDFRKNTKNKTALEINEMVQNNIVKFNDLLKKHNLTLFNKGTLNKGALNKTKAEKIEIIKENAKQFSNIVDKDSFANEYTNLLEFQSGIFSSINSKIQEKKRSLEREKKSKNRSLESIYNEIYPDKTVINNYKITNYTEHTLYNELNPYIKAKFDYNNLSIITNLGINFEMFKKLNNNDKNSFKNHVDFNGGIKVIYEF